MKNILTRTAIYVAAIELGAGTTNVGRAVSPLVEGIFCHSINPLNAVCQRNTCQKVYLHLICKGYTTEYAEHIVKKQKIWEILD